MTARLIRQIATRLGVAILTLWGASVAVFFGMHAIPGDAAQAALGEDTTPALLQALRVKFGLNKPLLNQYGTWLSELIHGHFGRSWSTGASVWTSISGDVGNTAVLALATIIVLVPIAVTVGILAAMHRGGLLDNVITSTTLTLISLPEFVIGTFLVALAAVWLHLLPAVSILSPGSSALSQPKILVLPVLTLVAGSSAGMVRMVRACMIDVLASEYIEMVRLKGVSERTVILRHALPNALGPTLQVFALTAAVLAGGVVVVETVFQYPGMGAELVDAVSVRDVPTVQAIVMIITGVYVLVNLFANFMVTLLNPRLRRGAT